MLVLGSVRDKEAVNLLLQKPTSLREARSWFQKWKLHKDTFVWDVLEAGG